MQAMHSSRFASVTAKIIIFFIGVLAALLLLEAALRTGALPYGPKKILLKPRAAGTQVILCIGDSFVYGIGAPRDKSFPQQLEVLLRQEMPTRKIQVINAGMPGKNIDQIYEQFIKDVDVVRPDIVFFLGGMVANRNFQGYYKFRQRGSIRGVCRDMLYKSSVYRLMRYIEGQYKRYPDNPRKLTERSLAASDMRGMPAEGERSRKALSYYFDGMRCDREGRYATAIDCYRRSIALCPKGNPSYDSLTYLYVSLNQQKNALACFQQGRTDGAYFEEVTYFMLGWACIQSLHDMDAAFEVFQQGIENLPQNDEVNGNYQGIMFLYNAPVGGHLKMRIKQYLSCKRNGEKPDTRAVIDTLDKIDFPQSIQEWKAQGINTIIDTCKSRHIPLLLQDYPESTENGLLERIARERSVVLVNHSRVFEKLLKTRPRSEYFVPDGHCNAAGYGVMAETLARTIREKGLLDPRSGT